MELKGKELRRIDYALAKLYKPESIGPVEFHPGTIAPKNYLARLLRFADGKELQFTEQGFQILNSIVKQFYDVKPFGDDADYADLWAATKDVVKELITQGVMPEDGNELFSLVQRKVSAKIGEKGFAVSIFGLRLERSQSVTLGKFTLVPSTTEAMKSAGVPVGGEHWESAMQHFEHDPVLIGFAIGTDKVAQRKFFAKSELLVGLIAVFVSANYENGATGFRFGLRLTPESSHGQALSLSWREGSSYSLIHKKFPRGQQLLFDDEFEGRLHDGGLFDRGLAAIEAAERSELEEAFVKALYWFCDAQRDSVTVMQFVKYWSCVETFFSRTKDIVRGVSSGLATVLVAGGGQYFRPDEYASLKRRITKLYAMRCRALHGASYEHVTERDVADLSQWTSWMLVTMMSLMGREYESPEQVWAQTQRLDAILGKGGEGAHK